MNFLNLLNLLKPTEHLNLKQLPLIREGACGVTHSMVVL